MKTKMSSLIALACLPAFAFGQIEAQNAASVRTPPPQSVPDANSPPMLGIHWAKGFDPASRATEDAGAAESGQSNRANRVRRTSANMTYHGGKIMPYTAAQAIFWGPSWATSPGDKITGMDSWYQGYGNSSYAGANTEYTGTNGRVGTTLTYAGHVVDTSASQGGGNTSVILAEVCKMIKSPNTGGNGFYAVYSATTRGNANYCAYHSAGTCGGVPVQFAFFFNADNDPGCNPGDTSGLHSEGLAAIANVTGHELSEAVTDPASPGAWYDGSGAENGDKCAWVFPVSLTTFSNGSKWKIQPEWSNAAYTAGTGYPNSSGQKGCIE